MPSQSDGSSSNLILVVDDEDANLAATARILEQANYRVLKATTGSEGLMLIHEARPQLVLLDVVLPDISGAEVCNRVKNDPKFEDTFIILVSGLKLSSIDKASGLDSGADSYITRPYSSQQLLALIEAILRLRNAKIALRKKTEQQLAEQAREMHTLETYHGTDSTPLTRQLLGVKSLSRAAPEIFSTLIMQYGSILDLAVEQHTQQVHLRLTEQLRDLGDALGVLNAGPRDVVEIHKRALKTKVEENSSIRVQLYLEEGRFCVLELMGYLVTYYRSIAVQTNRTRSEPRGVKGQGDGS